MNAHFVSAGCTNKHLFMFTACSTNSKLSKTDLNVSASYDRAAFVELKNNQ